MLNETDWRGLTPAQFEAFCADAMVALGFVNVHVLAGPGDKGRDIICERDIAAADILSERLTWVVQCKHYVELKPSDVFDDLAKVASARPDVWWLMTSAVVTPGFRDILLPLGRATYPFRIGVLDRPILSRIAMRFPALLSSHFTKKTESWALLERDVMQFMHHGKYVDAIQLLELDSKGLSPRMIYLLACSYSSLANMVAPPNTYYDRAFDALERAFRSDFVAHMETRYGWPERLIREKVWEDRELAPLRRVDEKKFMNIIGYRPTVGGGGGCFPADTRILTPSGDRPIGSIQAGERITTLLSPGAEDTGIVAAVHCEQGAALLSINGELKVTLTQPLALANGWLPASSIAIGDILLSSDGPRIVSDLAPLAMQDVVYSLTVEGRPQYYANGYLAHNKMRVV